MSKVKTIGNVINLIWGNKLLHYVNVKGEANSIVLEKDSLAFTYCQVPIIYKKSKTVSTEVVFNSGESKIVSSNQLDTTLSTALFQRTNIINKIILSDFKTIDICTNKRKTIEFFKENSFILFSCNQNLFFSKQKCVCLQIGL